MEFWIYNGQVVTGKGLGHSAILVSGRKIKKIISDTEFRNEILPSLDRTDSFDAGGKLVFAGGIDAHVHFREPGMTRKADMESESKAAVLGGVTSFIDMPNTRPATTSAACLAEKLASADGRLHANYGFHLGATNDNYGEIDRILQEGKDGICSKDFGGIKVFMGSSTGNMLVDDDNVLDSLFSTDRKEILVHCEDENTIRKNLADAENALGEDIPFGMHPDIRSREACILSSAKALDRAVRLGTRLHLLHVSTKEEVEMVRTAKLSNPRITAETSANYLWFCDRDYARLGSRIKCNPSIKTEEDRRALRQAVKDGTIDTVGSDHAPHLPEEKDGKYPVCPSGMPSVQQSLQVLLTVADQENIPLGRIAEVFSEKISSMLGIEDRGFIREGYYADIVIVDMNVTRAVRAEDIAYKCGWSPYEGETLKGRITDVFVNGKHAVKDSVLAGTAPAGERLIFRK